MPPRDPLYHTRGSGVQQNLTREASQTLWKLLVLSPDLPTLEALLKGQNVPRNMLDQTWARRFGL